MVATDLAEVAADPPEATRRTDRLVAKRTRRHGTVAVALKETALRSTVRLPTGPPVSIVRFTYFSNDLYIVTDRHVENDLYIVTDKTFYLQKKCNYFSELRK